MIRSLSIPVLLITSGKRLHPLDLKKYQEQYHNVRVLYNTSFHDRYFCLDHKTIYHCGTSLNYVDQKTFSVNRLEDELVKQSLFEHVDRLVQDAFFLDKN